jgi:K+-sensing histidine kinase KdpD
MIENQDEKIQNWRKGKIENFKLKLLSSLQHNLKTPLNCILTLAEANKNNEIDEI